jgi:hypothetical protein
MAHPSERAQAKRRQLRIKTPAGSGTEISGRPLKKSQRRELQRKKLEKEVRQAKRRQMKLEEAEKKRRAEERERLDQARRAEQRQLEAVCRRNLQPARSEGTIVGGGPSISRRDTRGVKPSKSRAPANAAPSPRPSKEQQSAALATNNQLREQLANALGSSPVKSASPAPKSARKRGRRGQGKANGRFVTLNDPARMRGGSSGNNFRGEISPSHDQDLADAFATAPPSFDREEDGSRHMGHSFRDQDGSFGSMPLHDDHDS